MSLNRCVCLNSILLRSLLKTHKLVNSPTPCFLMSTHCLQIFFLIPFSLFLETLQSLEIHEGEILHYSPFLSRLQSYYILAYDSHRTTINPQTQHQPLQIISSSYRGLVLPLEIHFVLQFQTIASHFSQCLTSLTFMAAKIDKTLSMLLGVRPI